MDTEPIIASEEEPNSQQNQKESSTEPKIRKEDYKKILLKLGVNTFTDYTEK